MSGLEVEFGPDRFADGGTGAGAPGMCEGRDEEEAEAGFGRLGRSLRGEGRELLVTGIGDLDADGRAGDGELELEVAAADVAVAYGVRAEFADDQLGGARGFAPVRVTPGVEALGRQVAGETGASAGGGEAHAEDVRTRDG